MIRKCKQCGLKYFSRVNYKRHKTYKQWCRQCLVFAVREANK